MDKDELRAFLEDRLRIEIDTTRERGFDDFNDDKRGASLMITVKLCLIDDEGAWETFAKATTTVFGGL